jgi:hypothetical protein
MRLALAIFVTLSWLSQSVVEAHAEPSPADVADSPGALVMQLVGATEIRVEYASPAANQRKLLGEHIPFGKEWPIGAEAPARLTVSRAVTIQGRNLPAGAYGLSLIPDRKKSTLIVKDEGDGDSKRLGREILRVDVETRPVPMRERLTFIFSDTTATTTRLDLEWAETRFSVPIAIDPKATSQAHVQSHLRDSWRPWAEAARVCLELGHLEEASAVIDASIALRETWRNLWIKAKVLEARQDHTGAYAFGERAYALGRSDPEFNLGSEIENSLKMWRAKALP